MAGIGEVCWRLRAAVRGDGLLHIKGLQKGENRSSLNGFSDQYQLESIACADTTVQVKRFCRKGRDGRRHWPRVAGTRTVRAFGQARIRNGQAACPTSV